MGRVSPPPFVFMSCVSFVLKGRGLDEPSAEAGEEKEELPSAQHTHKFFFFLEQCVQWCGDYFYLLRGRTIVSGGRVGSPDQAGRYDRSVSADNSNLKKWAIIVQFVGLLLRGAIVNRTYGIHKNLYI